MRLATLCAGAGLLANALMAGCAAAPRSGDSSRDDRSVITREQMMSRQFTTAYDAVRSLRGNWLIARGKESMKLPVEIQVYLDGNRMGGLANLQNISAETVQYIRFFSGIEATTRWGLDHGRGAIFVVTQGSTSGAFRPPVNSAF